MTDHIEGVRYCPRCDSETLWTNLPERGERLRCTVREIVERNGYGWEAQTTVRVVEGCGFDVEQEFSLTAEQTRRMRDYAAKFAPERRLHSFSF